LLTQKIKTKRDLALDGVVHGGRDTDAAGLGERFHARGDVDSIAVERPIGFLDHVS